MSVHTSDPIPTEPVLVLPEDSGFVEGRLTNLFFPEVRPHLGDYLQVHPKGRRLEGREWALSPVCEPRENRPEGLVDEGEYWEHPDYVALGINSVQAEELYNHTLIRLQGSATNMNQQFFNAFSFLLDWAKSWASAKEEPFFVLNSRTMLYHRPPKEQGFPVFGNILELADQFALYGVVLPQLSFLKRQQTEEAMAGQSFQPTEDTEGLHPDLLAIFAEMQAQEEANA
jgi:hypothetical protein